MEEKILHTTKRCPFCANEIHLEAIKCQYCNEFLDGRIRVEQFSNVQPIWQLIILSILTCGLYDIYWFYRNWKHFKVHHKLNISPTWRTVGLLIPLVGLVQTHRQLKYIRHLAKEAGIEKSFSPRMILISLMIFNLLSLLPVPYWFLSLFSVWPLTVVQRVLNSYWEKEQHGIPSRTKLSKWEIAIVMMGGIIFILGLIGTFLP